MDPADQPHQPDPGAGGADRAEQVRDQGSGQRLAARLFRFSQLEFPWALGPPDGRYVVRDAAGDASHVVVLSTLGAVERRRLRRRGGRRKADPEPDPAPVATARATVIDAAAVDSAGGAAAWLARAGEDELADGLVILNDVVHAYGVVAADPHARPVSRAQALVARVGFGEGEQVADGRWTEARELVAGNRRQRRVAALAPHARLAAVLGGREQPLVSEELALRARFDLDHGRDRAAALQVRGALDAAVAELAGEPVLAERVDELRGRREAVAAAARTALTSPLSEDEREAVAFTLARIEAAFRARAVARPSVS